MAKTSRYKIESVSSDVASAVADAFNEIEELASEMGEWRDNMEEKLSHTEKFERVQEAAETLEGLQQVDVDIEEDIPVTLSTMHKKSKRGNPRHMRLSNAVSALQASVEACQTRLDEINDKDDTEKTVAEAALAEALEPLIDELQNAIDEAEGVEFPGMFG